MAEGFIADEEWERLASGPKRMKYNSSKKEIFEKYPGKMSL